MANEPMKKLTDDQYNVLLKIAQKTHMDCWFDIRTDKENVDYIYDVENNKRISLRSGIRELLEGVDSEECYINCDLSKKEDAIVAQLARILKIKFGKDWFKSKDVFLIDIFFETGDASCRYWEELIAIESEEFSSKNCNELSDSFSSYLETVDEDLTYSEIVHDVLDSTGYYWYDTCLRTIPESVAKYNIFI